MKKRDAFRDALLRCRSNAPQRFRGAACKVPAAFDELVGATYARPTDLLPALVMLIQAVFIGLPCLSSLRLCYMLHSTGMEIPI